jgi:hypothetical protein
MLGRSPTCATACVRQWGVSVSSGAQAQVPAAALSSDGARRRRSRAVQATGNLLRAVAWAGERKSRRAA